MSVEHQPLLYFGWPISEEDVLKIAGDDADEPEVEVAVRLGCAVIDAGNAWVGSHDYYVSLMIDEDLRTWGTLDLAAVEPRALRVQAQAAEWGVSLEGPPRVGAILRVF